MAENSELDQSDLFMDFEEYVSEEEWSDKSREGDENTDEDDGSWEDVSWGEDDGEVGEQGAVDVNPAGEAAAGPRVPQPYCHEPLPFDGDGMANDGDAPRLDFRHIH